MSIHNHQEWLASALGCYLQAREQALYDAAVGDIFGFNALQLGMLNADFLAYSRMPFRCRADVNDGPVRCESSLLPFASSSIDVLLLPHQLEFCDNPHQALREAERILVPEGHMIITGFNPISLWGLRRLFTRNKQYPWRGRFLPLLRIKDWLALLGFEVVAGRMSCYLPPLSKPSWLNRFQFMDKVGDRWWPMMGGVYFVVAKKRVSGMTLIRPHWNKAKMKRGLMPAPSQKTLSQETRCQKIIHEQ